MNNFKACLIVFALITMSSDWLPSSNVLVEAGKRVLYSSSDCWRHDCDRDCPGTCRCPGVISRLFGRRSCY
uniref:Putative secreted salivary protein n=1 Tax=Rhipicephalus pulchellus TaxID=72859 RepID=L7M3V4_RHIPC